jgi:hypothetical protein
MLATPEAVMSDKNDKNELFVTRRDDGRYNVLRPNADRASAVTDTQRAAIDRAKAIEPDAAVHIQRVRSNPPGPDKFRHE